jgi:formate dehydrogenase alpha subunit
VPVNLKIDGRDVSVLEGANLVEAAEAADVYVPHLCWEPGLEADGACGLCVVGVEGDSEPALACETLAREGMVVSTNDPDAVAIRRRRLELIKADHANDCQLCPKNEHCELQEASRAAGVEIHVPKKLAYPSDTDKSHPMFNIDRSRCILCGKCVKVCRDLQGLSALEIAGIGYSKRVRGVGDLDIGESTCESCGQCVDRCPTASLLPKVFQIPTSEVRTICPYCGVGCAINLGLYYDRLASVGADREGPANRGALCVKGRFGIVDVVNSMGRLEIPQVRNQAGMLEAKSWDEALDTAAERLAEHVGKGTFALLASAKATNEDNYLLQKFARVVMGTNNVDHCARLCHSPSVAGLRETLGSGAMTGSIEDIDETGCIFVIGSNTTETHPVIGSRVRRAHAKGTTLIVCDPRRTDLAERADIWLRHNPGSDVALLMGICSAVHERDLHDRGFIEARTEGFEEFEDTLTDFDPGRVEELTGVEWPEIKRTARMLGEAKSAMFLYAMGITQHAHGTDNVKAISNLALLTGNLGRPGAGIAPLRGQNNVQGGGDVGALPNLLPGYQEVVDPEARARIAEVWGVEPPGEPGLALTELWDAVLDGKIKAMWIVGENPFLSDPDASKVEKALKALDLLIVQEVFSTDTSNLAHILLPSTTFAEKDGTFTNTERRVQLVRKALDPIGKARPDWEIVCDLAKRMGAQGFDFTSSAEVMEELGKVAPQYAGISHARLSEIQEGLQWPCHDAGHPGTPILHVEEFPRPGGKAAFVPLEYKGVAEPVDDDYPLVLTTGRSLYHFHTGSMTRKVSGLNEIHKEELVEIHPRDAERYGIEDASVIRVTSRRGSVTARAQVTKRSPKGTVFMTFHFAESPTNRLTIAALDPASKIAETKVCAVRVERAGDEELAAPTEGMGDDLDDLF